LNATCKLLLVPGLLVLTLAGCGAPTASRTSSCATQVGLLRNDSQVTVYQGRLVASCSSYSQFTHDYDSVKHESAYTPFALLVFCWPTNTPAAPDAVYNSTLCTTARQQDPEISALTASTAGQAGTSGAGTDASGGANSSPVEPSTPTATPSPQFSAAQVAKNIAAQSYAVEVAQYELNGHLTVSGVTVQQGRFVEPNTGVVSDLQVRAVIRNDTKLRFDPTVTFRLLDGTGSSVLDVDQDEGHCLAPGESERVTWSATLPAGGLPYYETVSVANRDSYTC